jgi:hypothetical protein
MDGLYEMTGSPTPIRIAGQEYLLGPWTAEDDGLLEAKIVSERRRSSEVLEELLPKLDKDQQRMLLAEAWADEVRGARVKWAERLEWLRTPRGRIFRLWLLFRRNHPELNQVDVARLLAASGREVEAAADESGRPLGNSSPPGKPGESGQSSSPGEISSEAYQQITVGLRDR